MTTFPLSGLEKVVWDLSFNYLRNSKGITLILLRLEIKGVIRIQIQTEPYGNNYGKHNEARAVVDEGKKGKQKNPEGSVISLPNEGKGVREPLLDGNIVG